MNNELRALCIIFPIVYINHRPAFGLSPAQLVKAFHVLGEGGSIDRAKLLTLLQENGQ